MWTHLMLQSMLRAILLWSILQENPLDSIFFHFLPSGRKRSIKLDYDFCRKFSNKNKLLKLLEHQTRYAYWTALQLFINNFGLFWNKMNVSCKAHNVIPESFSTRKASKIFSLNGLGKRNEFSCPVSKEKLLEHGRASVPTLLTFSTLEHQCQPFSDLFRVFPSSMPGITNNTNVFSNDVNLTNNNDLNHYEMVKNIHSLTEQRIMYKIGESVPKYFNSAETFCIERFLCCRRIILTHTHPPYQEPVEILRLHFLFVGHGLDKPLFPIIVIVGLIGNTLLFLVSLLFYG